ncbi:hypothetical protein SprV_0602100800 [Sparganum proliferum]
MKTNKFLFSFAAILSLFHTGCGEKMCSWSQRTIPRNATGDLTLEVPISYSYKVGYLGHEEFWTYGWEKGWCSYNEGYFRCPYTKHDDYDATSITLPNVEKISYVMLRSQYPITIHKSGDESFRAPETTPGPDTTADIVQEITTTAAANLTGAPETTPGPDTTADIVQEITTTAAANLTGAPETTPGPDTTADIVQEITTTEAANLTDSPETTLSPVITEEMMNETANSGATSFMGAITPTDRRMARPQDTALARFYGLPKGHKDGAPLRPIVSLKGTPTYGLAKWLFRRLKFLTVESDTTVSSSAQFLEKLKGDLAIETIELLLQNKYDETENRLGRTYVLLLLKFCLRTYFTFDRTIYEQVKGTSMGSPISGFIAEAVLQRLESLVFQHRSLPTPLVFQPKFWARYVDDTFVVIDRDQLLTVKERLNAVFPDIQFTMEEEENKQLAFLDAVVCRKDCGGLKTKVFRTTTNTMQALNFNSNHPISHKRNCVRTLYRRVETNCSEPEDKIAELKYL